MCESARTERRLRQRVVVRLGKLTEQNLAASWDDPDALLVRRRPDAKRF